MDPGVPRLIGAVMLLSVVASASGQSLDSFDVNVEATPSQQQTVTMGPSTLDTGTRQLRELLFIINRDRDKKRRFREQGEEQEQSADFTGAGPFHASLAPVMGGAASADEGAELGGDFAKRFTFGDMNYHFGDHDRTANTPAHDIETLGWTLGVDYRVRPTLVLGAAAAYLERENDFTDSVGTIDLESFGMSVLANWYVSPNSYVDGIVRYIDNDYAMQRRTRRGNTVRGTTGGDNIMLSTGSGYEFYFGAMTLVPKVRATYQDVSIDGYREGGGPGAWVTTPAMSNRWRRTWVG